MNVMAMPLSPRSQFITVPRAEIVGRRIDYQIAVGDCLTDIGAAIQYLAGAACPEDRAVVGQAARLLRDQRTKLHNLLALLRAESGELDGLCESEYRHAGHGAAA